MVEFSDEFRNWYESLSKSEQESLTKGIALLRETPSAMLFSSSYIRELRTAHKGCTYRVLYGFDLERATFVLLAGGTTTPSGWYETDVPRAEAMFAAYRREPERVTEDHPRRRTSDHEGV